MEASSKVRVLCIKNLSAETFQVNPRNNNKILVSLRSQVITSKQPKLGLMQELFFSRICESTKGYTFTPCVGSFTSPGIDTRQKGPPAFSVSSERHRQMWGEEIA